MCEISAVYSVRLLATLVATCAICSSVYALDGAGEQRRVAIVEDAEQEAAPSASSSASHEIGAATDELLAKQRAAQGSVPRMIDGEQAVRSYARYLKSFEHPLPESYEMSTSTKK